MKEATGASGTRSACDITRRDFAASWEISFADDDSDTKKDISASRNAGKRLGSTLIEVIA